MKPDIRYVNGTYQTCLDALDYVLPTMVSNYGADEESAAKIYTMIGHYCGLLCRKAGGDPLEVLRESPVKVCEAFTKGIRNDKGDDIEQAARQCMDCAAVSYGFVMKALQTAEVDEERTKNCLETWGFLTCVVFSLAACALDQHKASVMSAEVLNNLIEKKLFFPEWEEVVFNDRAIPQRLMETAMYIRSETGAPDYLSKFGMN